MGHVLDYKEKYYELHHQCFVVNLEYYREFGCPEFGYPQNKVVSLEKTVRSAENFHDEYTPYWVDADINQEGKKDYVPEHEGWNIINESVVNKKRIWNFSQKLRNLKTYL